MLSIRCCVLWTCLKSLIVVYVSDWAENFLQVVPVAQGADARTEEEITVPVGAGGVRLDVQSWTRIGQEISIIQIRRSLDQGTLWVSIRFSSSTEKKSVTNCVSSQWINDQRRTPVYKGGIHPQYFDGCFFEKMQLSKTRVLENTIAPLQVLRIPQIFRELFWYSVSHFLVYPTNQYKLPTPLMVDFHLPVFSISEFQRQCLGVCDVTKR